MKHIIGALILVLQLCSSSYAGAGGVTIHYPTLSNLKLANDPNLSEIRLIQSKVDDSKILAVYTPVDQNAPVSLIIISKLPIKLTPEEWKQSQDVFVESFKTTLTDQPNNPLTVVDDFKTALTYKSKGISNMAYSVNSVSAPAGQHLKISLIKTLINKNDTITFVTLSDGKDQSGTSLGATVTATTLMYLNGNLLLLAATKPYTSDDNLLTLQKYDNEFIEKFIEQNPNILSFASSAALTKNLPLANALSVDNALALSHSFTLYHLKALLIFFPLVITMYILQRLINRKKSQISIGALLFSWKGTLTGLQSFLGSLSAIVFYITLFFIPIVFLALTRIELFSQHRELFHGIFLLIAIGLVYSLAGIFAKYIRGRSSNSP